MIKQWFLEALAASLRGKRVAWDGEMSTAQWAALFQLAQAHQVLPMVFEAVYACPAAQKADPRLMMAAKRQTVQGVMMQAMRTGEFLALMKHLQAQGLTPCVVKGIACRSLYPNPDHRTSGDEDVLIPPQQAEKCHEAMLAFGMRMAEPQQDPYKAFEVPYGKPGSPIYIELHKSLFPPENAAYGDLNRFFEGVHARTTMLCVNGLHVATLSPTDHFFYLICHAFKHFLHSGFGLRQVCDIMLFAEKWGAQIDWALVKKHCEAIHAGQFAAALLRIGQVHLGFDPAAAGVPASWGIDAVDEQPMLCDLLDSGVFGDATMSRKHSSSVTLGAVSADRKGKKYSVAGTLFPGVEELRGRYPYLNRRPYLLPIAWVSRVIGYICRKGKKNDNTAESLRIAAERIELMRKYRIIR